MFQKYILIPKDEDRVGYWVRDRFRFENRIKKVEQILGPILNKRKLYR